MTAIGAIVKDYLPAGMTFVSSSMTGTLSGAIYTVVLPSLTLGQTGSFTLTATLPTAITTTTSYTNLVGIQLTTGTELPLLNNTGSDETTVSIVPPTSTV